MQVNKQNSGREEGRERLGFLETGNSGQRGEGAAKRAW
jgi:hypothetical protein